MNAFRRTFIRFLLLGVILSLAAGTMVALFSASVKDVAIREGLIAFLASLGPVLVCFAFLWRWLSRRVELVLRTASDLSRIATGEAADDRAGESMDAGDLSKRLAKIGTSVQRQRRALEDQKREMTEILDALGEGLLAIDPSGRILLANTRVHELFGVKPPLIGRPFIEVVRNARVIDSFNQALGGLETRERSTVLVRGSERQIEIRMFPLDQPSEIAVVALFIDVTQIQRLERIRRDFLADFTHEVRTPLTALRSAIETIESRRLPAEQELHLRRIIARQLDRMERLAQDLAELNSIESGELILHREPTYLLRLLADLSEDFSERARDRGILITIDGDEVVANVDPVRVEQIFSNLIDNAFRHAAGATELRLLVRDGSEAATVLVMDNGAGIPVDECEKIFHRLYRVDKSRSDESGGTGIGLAITKHLVLLHGGAISVTSGAGEGTTFTVELPKSPSSVASVKIAES